jgi:outer membrane protein TolC
MNGKLLRLATPALAAIGLAALSLIRLSAQPPESAAITLADALARAKQYGGQIQSANLAVLLAKEDSAQIRAGRLPALNAFNQYIHTEGNGTPSGVFVANDGVHVYNEQAQVHEELLTVFRKGEIRRAAAAEAIASAKVEVAARGLNATVIQNYYAIASAERKFVNAQTSLKEAEQFLDITTKQEKGGEAAHADVIKAQIQLQQRQRDLQDAQVAIEKSKIALGVLIFPNFTADFKISEDLEKVELLTPIDEARSKAVASSPDLKVARFSVESAARDIDVARYSYLPSLGLDFFYGIDANRFLVNGPPVEPGKNRQNFGYSGQITLNIPVWNWGITKSKIRQAEFKEEQAKADLSIAERTLQSTIAANHSEARAAQAQLDSLRSSVQLSVESLRLTILRYQAGEATALEVVDAQTTVTQARNALDDGLVRYKVALANLQTLTGSL